MHFVRLNHWSEYGHLINSNQQRKNVQFVQFNCLSKFTQFSLIVQFVQFVQLILSSLLFIMSNRAN